MTFLFYVNLPTKKNLMQILRDGRTLKVSIFDLVVGDVVPLKIGDQVGVLCGQFVCWLL